LNGVVLAALTHVKATNCNATLQAAVHAMQRPHRTASPCFVCGGSMGGAGKVPQSTFMRWGLGYTDRLSVERQHLMRMVVALAREACGLDVQ
jgi:hypothetical protein